MPRCCVVIPTFNEARHLPGLLARVFAQQAYLGGLELWVLVVDDDSPDGTAAVLRELQAIYPRLITLQGQKRGLGVAYQRGFAHALGRLHPDLLVQMDGDLQHDPAELPRLTRLCTAEVAAVVGSRFAPGGATPTFSARRRWTSVAGNWLIHRVTGLPHLYDYTSGYRCINAAALAGCDFHDLAVRGYAFQSSLITELLLSGKPVLEEPITFGQREFGVSKLARADYIEFALNLRGLRRHCGLARSAPARRGARAAGAGERGG